MAFPLTSMLRNAVGALLVLVVTAPAAAQSTDRRGPALNWVRDAGAESCITAAELAQRIERRLERPVFVLAQQSAITFDGLVQRRAAGGFVAQLSVTDVRGIVLGARVLESPDDSCRSLDEALVLIAALTLFPNQVGMGSGGIALDDDTNAILRALFGDEPTDIDPSDLPAAALPASVTPQAAASAEGAPAAVEPDVRSAGSEPQVVSWRLALEGLPIASVGVLPGVAFGVGGELSLRLRGQWPMRIGVAHFFERDQRAPGLVTAKGHFERSELTFFACPLSSERDSGFELCGGAALGLMRVTSDGFADGGIQATDPVLDVGGQAALHAHLFDWLVVRASLTALLPIVQRSYEYQALDATSARLFRSAQLGARLQIGVGAYVF